MNEEKTVRFGKDFFFLLIQTESLLYLLTSISIKIYRTYLLNELNAASNFNPNSVSKRK